MTLTVNDATVVGELQINSFDLGAVVQNSSISDRQGLAVATKLANTVDAVGIYLRAHNQVLRADGTACQSHASVPRANNQFVAVTITWQCSEATNLAYQTTLLQEIDPTARQIVILEEGEIHRQTLLDAKNSMWRLSAPLSLATVFARYLYAGIEHIFISYDHIAFLVGLVLWSQRLMPVVKAVTAFTLAHSITLALAVFAIIRVPSAWVEVAIALTIIYVAIENFFIRDIDRRWRVTL